MARDGTDGVAIMTGNAQQENAIGPRRWTDGCRAACKSMYSTCPFLFLAPESRMEIPWRPVFAASTRCSKIPRRSVRFVLY
jgi:hypothetical protein